MKSHHVLITGAASGLAGVCLGAFGAHGLEELLTQNDRLDTYNLAVEYQFYHAFAMLATGVLMQFYTASSFRIAAYCFAGGTVLFSGSLYVLALTNNPALGAITPFGGTLFIAGWLTLIWGVYKRKKAS